MWVVSFVRFQCDCAEIECAHNCVKIPFIRSNVPGKALLVM